MGKDCTDLHIKTKNKTNRINIFFITLIVFLIISIIVVFVRHRGAQKNSSSPPPPETTEANLTIKNFQHVATENGEKKWTLEASSASLYTQQDTARLTDISVTFSMKKGNDLSVHADKGVLNIKTNDMTISGNIIAQLPDYSLTTENLNYQHASRMIQVNEPVEIIGQSMTLKAGSFTYNLMTGTLTCENHVEGSFIEIHQ